MQASVTQLVIVSQCSTIRISGGLLVYADETGPGLRSSFKSQQIPAIHCRQTSIASSCFASPTLPVPRFRLHVNEKARQVAFRTQRDSIPVEDVSPVGMLDEETLCKTRLNEPVGSFERSLSGAYKEDPPHHACSSHVPPWS